MRTPIIIGNKWFNTPHPITPEEIEGRVVLVDFWTYSCVNCLRTLPYLKKWWERYRFLNFLIIGIHTPEFEFEKNPKNVEQAILDLEIEWPVVLDNEYTNWNNFANHYWPAKYLLDQNGYIVYEHFGEGNYAETETKIQEYLKKEFGEHSFPPIQRDEHAHGGFCAVATPELYLGYHRGRIANKEGFHEDHIGHYVKPDLVPVNSFALAGDFEAGAEYVESVAPRSTIYLHFQGTEVNLVMEPSNSFSIVSLKLNGESIKPEIMGKDVDQGDVIISNARMYNLIKSNMPISGTLSIEAKESDFKAYAFTFSGCVDTNG